MPLDEHAVQRLIDEAAIRAVTMRFGRGCDRLDFELVRQCFFDDAVADYGFYTGSIEGLIEVISKLLSNDLGTTHHMCNQEYEFAADDLAYVETMVIARHRQPPRDGAPLQDAIAFGTYCDRFEKRDGEWRIAHRLVLASPSRIDPVIVDFPFGPTSRFVPRGGSDVSGIVRP
jgi:hypothetical protein